MNRRQLFKMFGGGIAGTALCRAIALAPIPIANGIAFASTAKIVFPMSSPTTRAIAILAAISRLSRELSERFPGSGFNAKDIERQCNMAFWKVAKTS